MNSRPVAVDLFSGAGGLSLGFEQAGFEIVAAVEFDPVHAAVHKFNFPNCTVFAESIASVPGDRIRHETALADKEVTVVFGGPPCQGFSLIGQRALDDPRNGLVREFVRVVAELAPRYFLFENVKGLTIGSHRRVLDELVAEFQGLGYAVATPWRVLNAVNYGVPQDRERLFLLGSRHGCVAPSYPDPISVSPSDKLGLEFTQTAPTCEEALGDIPDAERYPELNFKDYVDCSDWGDPSPYVRVMRCMSAEHWYFGYPRQWDPNLLTSSARTKHTNVSRRRFRETQQGDVEPISRFFKLPARGVSNTLRAGTDSARGAFTSPRPIHYKYDRCITVREMARLHGFPDWFRFHKTKWHGARQVGNAVPPPLARSLAKEFIRALGARPQAPQHRLELGNPSLLELDMTRASEYWGIDSPIGRRDQKSGARKRKQEEIEAGLASDRPE